MWKARSQGPPGGAEAPEGPFGASLAHLNMPCEPSRAQDTAQDGKSSTFPPKCSAAAPAEHRAGTGLRDGSDFSELCWSCVPAGSLLAGAVLMPCHRVWIIQQECGQCSGLIPAQSWHCTGGPAHTAQGMLLTLEFTESKALLFLNWQHKGKTSNISLTLTGSNKE